MRTHVLFIAAVVFFSAKSYAALREGSTLTESNWADETVGFKVDPSVLGGFKAGDVIDKSNMDKAKEAIPEGVKRLMEEYGLKLQLRDYAPVLPSQGYIDATNKHSRSVRLIDTGNNPNKKGIGGHVAGQPFPNPQDGTEVAWNYFYRYQGDNFRADFKIFWVSLKRGLERTQIWDWDDLLCFRRTDLDPKPLIPDFAGRGIAETALVAAKEPFDVSGLLQYYYVLDRPSDYLQWIYIPSLRRIRQFSFGLRGESFNSTDLFLEDVRGYNGFVEWQEWKLLGKKSMLLPFFRDEKVNAPDADKTIANLNVPPYVNFTVPWELRPVYLVEAVSNYPQYPYGKMVFYIDAETNFIFVKEGYDRKGKPWKTLVWMWNQWRKGQPLEMAYASVIDHKISHATYFFLYNWRHNDPNRKPVEYSLTAMRKREGRD